MMRRLLRYLNAYGWMLVAFLFLIFLLALGFVILLGGGKVL